MESARRLARPIVLHVAKDPVDTQYEPTATLIETGVPARSLSDA